MKNLKNNSGLLYIPFVLILFILIYSCDNSKKEHVHEEEQPQQSETVDDHDDQEYIEEEHALFMEETREMLKKELGKKYNEPVKVATNEQIAQGKKIYNMYCAACHGPSGKGDGKAGESLTPKPADFTDAYHANFYSEQGRIFIIKKGIKGTGMAAWETALKDDEILAVYGYIKSLTDKDSNEKHQHQH